MATLFGGFLNTEASALRLNNKGKGGDIDWDHFVRLHSHKQELVPQFCEAKYCTTTLSRKWSEVRTKRTGVRNCLKMQLEQQLKGIKNVDIKDIMDKFHLSHIVQVFSPDASIHARRGGHARRDASSEMLDKLMDAAALPVESLSMISRQQSRELNHRAEEVYATVVPALEGMGACCFDAIHIGLDGSEQADEVSQPMDCGVDRMTPSGTHLEQQQLAADVWSQGTDEASRAETSVAGPVPILEITDHEYVVGGNDVATDAGDEILRELQDANVSLPSTLEGQAGSPGPTDLVSADVAQKTGRIEENDSSFGKHVMTVEEWACAANKDERYASLIDGFARMYLTFSRQVLHIDAVTEMRAESDCRDWEQRRSRR